MQTLVNPQRAIEAKQTVRNMFLQLLIDKGCDTKTAQRACNKAINYLTKKGKFLLDENNEPFNWDKPLTAYPPIIVECFEQYFIIQAMRLAKDTGNYALYNKLNVSLNKTTS